MMTTVPSGTLAETIALAIQQGFAQALEQERATLAGIAAGAGSNNPPSSPLSDVGDLSDLISALTDVISLLDPAAGVPIKLMQDMEGKAGKAGIAVALGSIIYWLASQVATPLIEPLQHAIASAVTNEIFDPNTAARLAAHGTITPQFGASEAAGGGFDQSHFNELLDDAYQRPDLASLLDLWNRGSIQEADVDLALQKHGIPQFWWDPLKGTRTILPAPADIALGLLRGNLTDAEAQDYARMIGLTSEVLQVLEENTGEPPGLMQLLEAYRRGFIDEPTLERGVRQSRVRNEWIPTIEKLRFTPMSVADAARAVVENYLPDAEGAKIAAENGLEPAHWQYIVESWGRPLSHEQMMALYHRGQVTIDEVHQAFRESDLKDKYIDKAVELGRVLIPERMIVQAVDHAVIDRPTAIRMLMERGLSEPDANLLVNLGVATRSTSHRTLTKGDILTMYQDALINRATAEKHLTGLGYSQVDAVAMLDLADYKRKAASLKTTERGIEASLKAHHLTSEQAQQQLVKAGLDVAQAQTLVDEWLQQRSIVTRTLTEAQTLKAVKENIIGQDEGRVRLKALGLADTDITILYKIDGILPVG